MTAPIDRWVLLDMRGLIYHSMFGSKDPDATLSSQGNELPTAGHAVDKFIDRYLKDILANNPISNVIACWDGGNVYRAGIAADYKANRAAIDEEKTHCVNAACSKVRDLLNALGVLQTRVEGVEADDLLAYFCKTLPGVKSVYTVDRDLYQLKTNPQVIVFYRGVIEEDWTPKGLDRPLPANLITLYKSIVGDTSDNYNGVAGIGVAGFRKMWDEIETSGMEKLCGVINACLTGEDNPWDTLEAMAVTYKNPILPKLNQSRDEWFRSWRLAMLHPEIIGSYRKDQGFLNINWVKRLPSLERLTVLLEETQNEKYLNLLKLYAPSFHLITAKEWEDSDLAVLRKLYEDSNSIAIDWETTDKLRHPDFQTAAKTGEYVDLLSSEITGAGITVGKNHEHTFYFSFDHADTANLPRKLLVDMMRAIPADKPVIAHNANFERTVLLNSLGYDIPNLVCTKILSSHVDENLSAGLKDLSSHYFKYKQTRYSDIIDKGKTMSDYSAQRVFAYGADDPFITAHLYDLFRVITLTEGTYQFVLENEMPAMYVMSDAYLDGVSIDWDELARQTKEDLGGQSEAMEALRKILADNQTTDSTAKGAANLLEEWVAIDTARAQALVDKFIKIDAHELAVKALENSDLTPDSRTVKLKEEEARLLREKLVPARTFTYEEFKKGLVLERTSDSILITFEEYIQQLKDAALVDLSEKCSYTPLEKVPVATSVAFTPIGINKLAKRLEVSLYPFDELTKAGVIEYQQTLKALHSPFNDKVQYFFDVLSSVDDTLSTKDRKEREANIKSKLSQLMFKVTPEENKYSLTGTELNLSSPIQNQILFYGMLGLPIKVRNPIPTGARKELGLPGPAQANEDAINWAIANDVPSDSWQRKALEAFLIARKAETRNKLFYAKYPLWRHPKDGLIHPILNSVGTETRRPTGGSPNPLQWPKKGEGVKFRRCILPNAKKGHDLVISKDFDQQELRVLAGLSGDDALLSCYKGNALRDVHSMTAAGIAKVDYETFMAVFNDKTHPDYEKYKALRRDSKTVNFGSSYGIGPEKLSLKLLCDVETAKTYLESKKATYHRVEEWKREISAQVRTEGYVTTLFGSRRHVYEAILSEDTKVVGSAERQVVNYLIQGFCADLLKKVLAELFNRKTFVRYNASLIVPLYDELVFTCHHSVAADLILEIHEAMTRDISGLPVPILAGTSLGANFGDQKEIGNTPTKSNIEATIAEVLGGDIAVAA